jgi:hypothetical protein
MNITAIADDKTFSLEAALAKLDKPAFRLMTAVGVGLPQAKIPVAALDRQLAASRLTTQQRLELKVSLSRVGLLAE